MPSSSWPIVPSHYTILIIGAGFQGLSAANTFVTIEPSLQPRLLILDANSTIGGVWARHNLYEGLRTNNRQGYYEFSDYPMLEAGLGVEPQGELKGQVVSEYVEHYAEKFKLLERCRLGVKVLGARLGVAEKVVGVGNGDSKSQGEDEIWTVEIASVEYLEQRQHLTCDKLIIATGQHSDPYIPSFSGAPSNMTPGTTAYQTHRVPIIHTKQLGTEGQSLLNERNIKHVTIIGGAKSAHDAVYMFATAGIGVTWITRRNGRGVMPMANSFPQIGPLTFFLEGLLMSRPLSWFGICPWSDADGFRWIRRLLHSTRVGRGLVRAYFNSLSASSLDQAGILKYEKTRKLVPDQGLMWYGTQAGTLQYPVNIYEMFANNHECNYIREDIVSIAGSTLYLANGQKLKTDAIICATGYHYALPFPLEPASESVRWGVPQSSRPNADHWLGDLDSQADKELLSRFPELLNSPDPKTSHQSDSLTPWRLYRFIAPPSQVPLPAQKRNLAFLNTISSYQTTIKCELTALWTYAYLHGLLLPPSSSFAATEADAMAEATLWSRFGRWAKPMGLQGKAADFGFHDSMPYFDTLMRDLGLKAWRKGGGWWGEVFGGGIP